LVVFIGNARVKSYRAHEIDTAVVLLQTRIQVVRDIHRSPSVISHQRHDAGAALKLSTAGAGGRRRRLRGLTAAAAITCTSTVAGTAAAGCERTAVHRIARNARETIPL
jgi:hypothetical protein